MTAGSARVAAYVAFAWIAGCGGSSGTVDAGPKGAGAACGSDSDCFSSLCKGHCCGRTCATDPECGAIACDSAGACAYPSGACGTSTCNGATAKLTASACQSGTCVQAAPHPCDGHFGCMDVTACADTCSYAVPCAPNFFCNAGACAPLGAPGDLCPFDAGCLSGICGAGDDATARCCADSCATGDDAGCGATGCDGRGACLYPASTTLCQPQTCVGNSYTGGANCDGQGHCPGTSGTCAPFACGANGTCQTTCSGNADCFNGFCGANNKCCASFANNAIFVDGTSTATRACCGQTPAAACKFLADAVVMASEAKISGMALIVLTKPADPGVVQLSYDVVVSAPGVTLPPLLIARFPGDTSTSVVVGGDSRKAADLSGAGTEQVTIEDSMTLYLLNATLSGYTVNPLVQVNPGGALRLGTDGSSQSGTVAFTAPDGGVASWTAIACQGTAAAPASVDDSLSNASPSVHFEKTIEHLVVGDYCSVNLTHDPIFGPYTPCTYLQAIDDYGLSVTGAADVTISNAYFQCFARGAITMGSSALGSPTVSGANNIVRISRAGIDCQGGTFTMTDTLITGNLNGVVQSGAGIVDLSGGGNAVTCNRAPPVGGSGLGVDVLNMTADAGLNARNVAWDAWDADAGHTERWSCLNASYDPCVCTGAASCSNWPYIENDADTLTFNGILVDDTGGSLVPPGPLGSCF